MLYNILCQFVCFPLDGAVIACDGIIQVMIFAFDFPLVGCTDSPVEIVLYICISFFIKKVLDVFTYYIETMRHLNSGGWSESENFDSFGCVHPVYQPLVTAIGWNAPESLERFWVHTSGFSMLCIYERACVSRPHL